MARPVRLAPPSPLARLLAVTAIATVVAASVAVAAPAVPVLTEQAGAEAPLSNSQLARRLSAEIYGYLPYWEIDSGVDAYLRYDLLTDIALFSVGFNASGAIVTTATGYSRVTGSTAATIVSHAHAAGVRVDLTVTSFGFDKNAAFFSNPTAMSNAAAAIAALVNNEDLDGVSLDVELLENAYFAAYGTFVGQIRTALRATNPNARVSVATNGSISGTGMANQALANGADRVFIMGYSYRTEGANPAGSIAPVIRTDGGKSLTWTLDLYRDKGVPANRILIGLPYYGRSWNTTTGTLHSPTTSSAGVFIPSDDLAAIPAGTPIQDDPVEASKWFAVQDPVTHAWTQTYFDDPWTLRTKYTLAASRGLAGVGIWTLGYDRGVPGYWNSISAIFGTTRITGNDRFATAAAVSAEAFAPGVGTAYVASGWAVVDGVVGAAAAGGSNSPLLLVGPASVPASTAAELIRLKPSKIVVLGGTGAVSDTVLVALAAFAPGGVTRLAGVDRFETAAAISRGLFPGTSSTAYVVSGYGLADALTAGPAAARDHAPVLLTTVDRLPEATRVELTRLAPTKVVIVGGTGVVGPAVEAAIVTALPGVTIQRLAGANRYATAAAVGATFAHGPLSLYVASGQSFADAPAAAAAAGSRGVPLLLSAPLGLPAVTSSTIQALAPARALVVGGPAVLSDVVLVAVRSAVAIAS